MSDTELLALTALVGRETIQIQNHLQRYGEPQFDPATPASKALEAELERRKVIA